ncbi:MAG: hypothetical protein IJZ93_01960 [Clostridia bacterium]|nr:hypothetical protein [Clostridia bacterium]
MEENNLKHIEGKKIRRQYFNIPLIILYSLMLAIPYAIFTISLCIGKSDSYEWSSTLWTSIWICFFFSLPLLVLSTLNKHCFGRILCVLNKEGIHFSNKGKLRWEVIEKIEYVIDSKPRYKSDTKKAFRAIIYTQGGKHIVLANVPLYIVSRIKKYQKGLEIKILGITSLLPVTLVMVAILLLCPFYVVLLRNAPGASVAHFIVLAIIWLIFGIIRTPIFDMYDIRYRFWSKVLPKKWLSYMILGCYYSSFFVVLLILFYLPNWVVVSILGVYLGIVQPPMPSKYGSSRFNYILSYDKLWEIYINKADFWEDHIAKNKKKRAEKKSKK